MHKISYSYTRARLWKDPATRSKVAVKLTPKRFEWPPEYITFNEEQHTVWKLDFLLSDCTMNFTPVRPSRSHNKELKLKHLKERKRERETAKADTQTIFTPRFVVCVCFFFTQITYLSYDNSQLKWNFKTTEYFISITTTCSKVLRFQSFTVLMDSFLFFSF